MKIKTLISSPVGIYSCWNGITQDGKLICIFLAHNVLHVSIYDGPTEEGISYRKPVECPGQSMITEEMMRQLELQFMVDDAAHSEF